MNYKKDNNERFTNTDTLVRREWIECAIAGARARLDEPLPVAEAANLSGLDASLADEAGNAEAPHLELVWSADERRSGT